MHTRLVRLACVALAASAMGLSGAGAQPQPAAPHPPLTVYNVGDKINGMEGRADRLRAVRRGQAVKELRDIRAELEVLKKRGNVTDAELEPLNDRLDAWVIRYNLKALPIQT
jgi:hypothetical protein